MSGARTLEPDRYETMSQKKQAFYVSTLPEECEVRTT